MNGVDTASLSNESEQGDEITYIARKLARLSDREKDRLTRILYEKQTQHDTDKAYRGETLGEPIPGSIGHHGLEGYSSQELGLNNIDDAMKYQEWHPGQVENGNQVRDALTFAAKAILRNVPSSPLRTRALNDIIDCRMKCNAAITFGGRF